MPAIQEKFNQTEVKEDKEIPINPEDAEIFSKNINWEKLKNIVKKFKNSIKKTSRDTIDQGDDLLTATLDNLDASPEEKLAGQNYIEPVKTEIEQLASEESAKIERVVENDEVKELDNFSKAYHHPEYRNQTARQFTEAKKSGLDVNAIKQEFYRKTAVEKDNFESQKKERNVAEIMKEKDLVIVHAIPLTSLQRKSSLENNSILKSGGYQNFETSVEILSGLSPTISTSIPSPEKNQNGLYYPSGVILGEGKVLSANSYDSGSIAHGLYKRIPKFGEKNGSAIQTKIDIDKITKEEFLTHYNELTVEKPQIAGLFYDLTEDSELPLENPKKEQFIKNFISSSEIKPSQEKVQEEIDDIDERWKNQREESQMARKQQEQRQKSDLYSMKKYSEEFNVPLYIFKKEQDELKKYRVKFLPREEEKYFIEVIKPKADQLLAESEKSEDNKKKYENYIYGDEYMEAKGKSMRIEKSDYTLEEVNAKDIYESKKDISDEERKNMIDDIKNKDILSNSAEKEVNRKFKN